MNRRNFMKLAAAMGLQSVLPKDSRAATTQPIVNTPQLVRFPEKTDLILLTDRPPQLETPIKYFLNDLTPNEAFFVRWHMAGIPTAIDTDA